MKEVEFIATKFRIRIIPSLQEYNGKIILILNLKPKTLLLSV